MEPASLDFGGSGRHILVLHGLFGSARNWATVGRFLSRWGHAVALDCRNHGSSPHAPAHTLPDLIADLIGYIDRSCPRPPLLLGHSMGGLTAMGCALLYPQAVDGLIVVDIAPRAYSLDIGAELAAFSLDPSGFESRREADAALAPLLPDRALRQFLLLNLERAGHGFRWKLNVKALESAAFAAGLPGLPGSYGGRTLFLRGGASDYILDSDLPEIARRFPQARVETLPGAGHWPHHSHRPQFEAALARFLSRAGREPHPPGPVD
jgi:esterase